MIIYRMNNTLTQGIRANTMSHGRSIVMCQSVKASSQVRTHTHIQPHSLSHQSDNCPGCRMTGNQRTMSILEVGNPRKIETGHRQLCPSTKGKERMRGTVTTNSVHHPKVLSGPCGRDSTQLEPYRRVHNQRTVDQRKYPSGKQNWTTGYLQYNTNIRYAI